MNDTDPDYRMEPLEHGPTFATNSTAAPAPSDLAQRLRAAIDADEPWKHFCGKGTFTVREATDAILAAVLPVCLSDLTALRAELAAAREDSALLDWIEANKMILCPSDRGSAHKWECGTAENFVIHGGGSVRAAIAAARDAERKETT